MTWELKRVEPLEAMLDGCGLYTVIHRVGPTGSGTVKPGQTALARVDVMDVNNEPVRSFIGYGNDVRKAVVRFMESYLRRTAGTKAAETFSREHASYIGWEVHRAETTENYVQD